EPAAPKAERGNPAPARSAASNPARAPESVFLSTLPATPRDRRIAAIAAIISIAAFAVLAPMASRPLPQVTVFIPVYHSAFPVCQLLASVLLVDHNSSVWGNGLSVLASGYMFSALMVGMH